MSNIKLFQSQQIRSHWDAEREQWLFSVIDIIQALTGNDRPRKYWSNLKKKLKVEGNEVSDKIGQLKMQAPSTRRMAITLPKLMSGEVRAALEQDTQGRKYNRANVAG